MFKKIFTELFSSEAAQPETTTHTASASLSADALNELEQRKMAIVADITRLAAELATCPSLGAPVGVGTLAGGLASANPAATATPPLALKNGHAAAHAAAVAEWLGRGEPWTGEDAATCRDAERDFGRPSPALSPTWAATCRDAERDFGRPSPALSPTWAAPERAVLRAHLAAKLHDAGDTAALRAAEAAALAAMKRKGAK